MDVVRKLEEIAWHKGLRWEQPSINEDGVKELLKQCAGAAPRENHEDVNEVIAKSREFPVAFPIDTVRCEKLKQSNSVEKLNENIRSTYPVLHERVLVLMAEFLLLKRKHGSKVERELYKSMSILDLIDRILRKRALVFMKKQDVWKLLGGEKGQDGWESIGTDREKPPLVLRNCLSYDELKLSALVSVSGPTVCINDGARSNKGRVLSEGIEKEAIIMGIIGPRFQRPGRMECEDLLITEQQNTADNGYDPSTESAARVTRQLWERFYQLPSVPYSSLGQSKLPVAPRDGRVYTARYTRRPRAADVLDAAANHRRLTVLADTILLEANARAEAERRPAFVNVIGAGLGVWKISPHQCELFVLSFLLRVHELLSRGMLGHVADVNFAYIRPADSVLQLFKKLPSSGDDKETKHKLFFKLDSHPRGGISVWVWQREPSAKLSGELEGRLPVLTYAWDSNAHPGNEFWLGKLATSGDPAAACSTQVAELHNANVNTALRAGNTRVAGDSGLLHIGEYCRRMLAG